MDDKADSIKVIFEPEGRTVHVAPGTTILQAASQAEIMLETPCGGKGHCGKCRVRVSSGAAPPTPADEKIFSKRLLAHGMRLACQHRVTAPIVVEVPEEARFFGQKILVDGIRNDVALDPTFRKAFITVPAATLEDQSSDFDRLKRQLAPLSAQQLAALSIIRDLPGSLTDWHNELTVVMQEHHIVALEAGNTATACYGVAVDIGTTTVVGMLVDLCTGTQCMVASRINPQVPRGDDVISRLTYIRDDHTGLKDLHERIVGCINEIVAELCEKSGIVPDSIYELTAVGNTTMSHILLGVNPGKLAESPFAAVVRESVAVKAAEMGVRINPRGSVYVAPNIAGFVGGDTVGVILATGMMHGQGNRLAIDIGTNGELVLASHGRVVSCSTAAGPAFEGARIKQGMRAANGAIDKVFFNEAVEFTTIGGQPPRGICGTGLIDSVAEMVRTGVVDYTGRIINPDEAPLPGFLKSRIVADGDSNDFILVESEKAHSGHAIRLTQRDVREVQLAKGAMRAGIEILMSELGVTAQDIDEIYLAGAFGNFIRESMARQIGLLPDVSPKKIKFVGNAAGTGARMLLMAKPCRAEADMISTSVRYVELAGRPDFQQAFMMSMLFPGAA